MADTDKEQVQAGSASGQAAEGAPNPAAGAAGTEAGGTGPAAGAQAAAGTDPGAGTSATEPKATIARLEAELAKAREEARDYFNRLVRLQADFENYRKRAQREREETIQYANLNLVRDLLPVLDNLERALAAAGAEGATLENLRTGVELTVRQFLSVLEKAGVTPVEAVGQPFDPSLHEAVQQVEGDCEVPTVVEEYLKGYRMGDRLVRPSMVKVAKR